METNELATDHIWFTVGKTIKELNLTIGEKIQFVARVTTYIKGYVNGFIDERTVDLKLNRPTKFIKITN